jgi:hypothetical protein
MVKIWFARTKAIFPSLPIGVAPLGATNSAPSKPTSMAMTVMRRMCFPQVFVQRRPGFRRTTPRSPR